MCTGHDGSTTIKVFRWTRVVEGGCLGVQLHVLGVDTRPVHPRVVEVALPSLNQEDLELVVQVGETYLTSILVLGPEW